jgi:hypothetical protein
VELEAKVLEVAIGERLELKLLNDGQEVCQRTDLGERRQVLRPE